MIKLFGKKLFCVLMDGMEDWELDLCISSCKGIAVVIGYAIYDMGIVNYTINKILSKYLRNVEPIMSVQSYKELE